MKLSCSFLFLLAASNLVWVSATESKRNNLRDGGRKLYHHGQNPDAYHNPYQEPPVVRYHDPYYNPYLVTDRPTPHPTLRPTPDPTPVPTFKPTPATTAKPSTAAPTATDSSAPTTVRDTRDSDITIAGAACAEANADTLSLLCALITASPAIFKILNDEIFIDLSELEEIPGFDPELIQSPVGFPTRGLAVSNRLLTTFAPTNDALTALIKAKVRQFFDANDDDVVDYFESIDIDVSSDATFEDFILAPEGSFVRYEILLSHIVGIEISSSELVCQQTVGMLSGQPTLTDCVDDKVFQIGLLNTFADKPEIITPDIFVSNGVIHIINGVIIPELNVADVTESPSESPTLTPTESLEPSETPSESLEPSESPSISLEPTGSTEPSASPSASFEPSDSPSKSVVPSASPSAVPSPSPSTSPVVPTPSPSSIPSDTPTDTPSVVPTLSPSSIPSGTPTDTPSVGPTVSPTETSMPSSSPGPTNSPTNEPTNEPTKNPTRAPTNEPTKNPTKNPTRAPTNEPTNDPTRAPTKNPTRAPTNDPTKNPTRAPTKPPTSSPTPAPTSTDLTFEPAEVDATTAAAEFKDAVSNAGTTVIFEDDTLQDGQGNTCADVNCVPGESDLSCSENANDVEEDNSVITAEFDFTVNTEIGFNDCCSQNSCISAYVDTETRSVSANGGTFSYNIRIEESKLGDENDWYEVGAGLYKNGVISEFKLFRGSSDVALNFNESFDIGAGQADDYFVRFFLGSYDFDNDGLLEVKLKVRNASFDPN